MRIRRLERGEVETRAEELHGLLDRALRSSPLAGRAEHHLARAWVDLDRAAHLPTYHTFGAEGIGGELMGFALGPVDGPKARLPGQVERRHPGFAAGALMLVWIAVEPSWRRRGAASGLLDVITAVPDTGRCWGFVDPANLPARNLYQRHGWRRLGVHRGELVLGYRRRAID